VDHDRLRRRLAKPDAQTKTASVLTGAVYVASPPYFHHAATVDPA
jgi:hypothetical protein